MGRIRANTIHQLQTHQEYTSHELVESFDHQQAETIEEIPPPSTELFHEDLYPEESQNEPSQELIMQSKSQENQDSVQQHQQSVLLALTPSPQQPTSRPVTTQRPRKQRQPKSGVLQSQQPSQHNSFPPVHDPQPQAEAFPPPQSQPLPHAFPPVQDYYEPRVFPPTQEEAQAFPPTPVHAFPQPHAQSVPQAFPPAQDSYEPHEFSQAVYCSQPNRQFLNAATGLVQAPKGMPPASPMPPTEFWKTGLFDCMEDPTNAFITACFPCLTFGQIAEIVDSGHTTCTTSGLIYGAIFFVLMPCIMSCTYRTKLRSQYGLIESPAPDWVIHCFCECCALCQRISRASPKRP